MNSEIIKVDEVLPPEPAAVVPLDHDALPPRLRKKLGAAPAKVQGTWEAARRWVEHAKYLQEAALYCQVMLGFELLALRDAVPSTRGRPSKGEIPAASAGISFTSIATKETGLSERTVRVIMSMAEASITRLRKLPALRDFDPIGRPIGLLEDAQKSALSAAVKKLTDGLTQGDFLVELGLAKAPQGYGAKGGAKPRRDPEAPAPMDEQIRVARVRAKERFASAIQLLDVDPCGFCLLADAEVMFQIAELEAQLKARRLWLSKPQAQRDVDAIQAVFEGR